MTYQIPARRSGPAGLSLPKDRSAVPDAADAPSSEGAGLTEYLCCLSLLERLHRLLLDVIKDEFERLGVMDVNPVQALLLYNIGENEVTAGELRTRGYYQGSNVSYNLKKLVESGFMHHQRSELDRRTVRVRLTPRGKELHDQVAELFSRHARLIEARRTVTAELAAVNAALRQLERFWAEQIRYIY